MSPGCAGAVVTPAKRPLGLTRLQLAAGSVDAKLIPNNVGTPAGAVGAVATPANGPAVLTSAQLAWIATGYEGDHKYKPGDSGCKGIVNELLATPLLFTTTLTGPSEVSSGAWTVI